MQKVCLDFGERVRYTTCGMRHAYCMELLLDKYARYCIQLVTNLIF